MTQIIMNYLGVLIIPVLIGFLVRFLLRRKKKGYWVTVAFTVLTAVGWILYNALRMRGGELIGIWALMISSAAVASFLTGFIVRLKKKENVILALAVIICVAVIGGPVYLFFEIYPMAQPIKYPEVEEVDSVTLGCNTPDATIPMSNEYFDDLILYIEKAKPTRRLTVDDYPSNRPYYVVEVQKGKRQYRYFVYEEGEQVYVEIPYEGVYKADDELFSLVLRYFEES